jgi:steroid 5-alpha reductase family enzyme
MTDTAASREEAARRAATEATREQSKIDAVWIAGFGITIVVATLVMAGIGVGGGWAAAIAVFLSALTLLGALASKLTQVIVAIRSAGAARDWDARQGG